MTKRIVIPTDFRVESLNFLKTLFQQHTTTSYDVVFVHGYNYNMDISDLLFMNKSEVLGKLISQDFDTALDMLKSRYPKQIVSTSHRLFTGWNSSAFSGFINAIEADEICIPQGYEFKCKNKNSFDVSKLLKKCNLQKTEVTRETKMNVNSLENQQTEILMPAPLLVKNY